MKFDSKTHLLAFKDLVYDLNDDKLRPIEKDDYLSCSVGYNYPVDLIADKEKNDQMRADILGFLTCITMSQEEADYLLNTLARMLMGGNLYNHMIFLTGCGGNGKSVLANLMTAALGEGQYAGTMSSHYFSSAKKAGNETDPEMISNKNLRVLIVQEPENGEKGLNASKCKAASGGDSLRARLLFSNDVISFVPQFSMLMCMNICPDFNAEDGGLQRRIKRIHLPKTFSLENGPKGKNKSNYSIGVPEIMKRMMITETVPKPEYGVAFLLLLIETYAKVIRGHERKQFYETPLGVITATAELMEDNSHTGAFMDSIVEDPGNKFLLISIKEMYDEIVEEEKIPKKEQLKHSDFMTMLKSKMGDPVNTKTTASGKTKKVPDYFTGWNFQAEVDNKP